MEIGRWKSAASLIATCILLVVGAQAYGAKKDLPPEVVKAVRKAFPKATIGSYGRETENGVRYYEVNLRQNGLRIEVEVDKYGGIGEVERRISLDEAPKDLVEALSKIADDTNRIRIERHERWGVARNGVFVQLDRPRVFYEVKVYVGGRRRELKWRPGEHLALPQNVSKAVRAAFPRAVITETEKENEDGVTLYEIALIQDGQDIEVKVSLEGVVTEIETGMSFKHLPKAVATAVSAAIAKGQLMEVARLDIRALAKSGKCVKLDEPLILYEVEYAPATGKAKVETVFASDGTAVKTETHVAVKDLPEAVISAVARAARGAKVVDAEKEVIHALIKPEGIIKLGQPRVVYELELLQDGMEAEIQVMENGTLARGPQWEAIEEDDDDDDDD